MTPLFSTDELLPVYERFVPTPLARSAAEEAVEVIESMLQAAQEVRRVRGGGREGQLTFEAVPHVQHLGVSEYPGLPAILAIAALQTERLREKVGRFRVLLRGGETPSASEEGLWGQCLAAWETWLSSPDQRWPDTVACSAGL